MMKKLSLLFSLLILLSISIYAGSGALSPHYSAGAGISFSTDRTSYPVKHGDTVRTDFSLRGSVELFEGEESGGNSGRTYSLEVGLPLHREGSFSGSVFSFTLAAGAVFRSRPWDYIDIALAVKGTAGSSDILSSVSFGVESEVRVDLWLYDEASLYFSLVSGGNGVRWEWGKDFSGDYGISRKCILVGMSWSRGGYTH